MMKTKLICVLAACLMVLSLAACGGSADTPTPAGGSRSESDSKSGKTDYGKYEYLIEMLEEGNYEEALDIVNGLRYEARQKENENADDQPLMDVICGTFQTVDGSFELEIKDDYTVTYNGSSHLYNVHELLDTLEAIKAKKDFYINYEESANKYPNIHFGYNEKVGDYLANIYLDDKSYNGLVRAEKLDSIKAPVMEAICGKYSTLDGSATLTIKDDLTFELNEASYPLKLDFLSTMDRIESKESLYIPYTTSDGEENSFELRYNNRIEDYYANLYFDNDSHQLYREGCLEPVELTLDNYSDYFEYETYLDYSTNSFGEISSVYIGDIFRTKEGLNVFDGEAAIEFSYVGREVAVISYDTDAKTFELGEETERSKQWNHNPYTSTTTLRSVYNYEVQPSEFSYFGTGLYSDSIDKEENTVDKYEYEITRIQGTLYLIAKP